MSCPRCVKRGQPAHFGSPPRCAFESGRFSRDNWSCSTVDDLRSLIENVTHGDEEGVMQEGFGIWCFRSRLFDRSCGLIFTESLGWVHLAWYKERGTTDMIVDSYGSPLKLSSAEEILELAEKNGWNHRSSE